MNYLRFWDTYDLSDVYTFNSQAGSLFESLKVQQLYLTDLEQCTFRAATVGPDQFHSIVYKYLERLPHSWLMHAHSAEIPIELSKFVLHPHFDFDEADLVIERILDQFRLALMPWGPDYEHNCLMVVTKDRALDASIERTMLTKPGTTSRHPFFRALSATKSLREGCNALMIDLFPWNGDKGHEEVIRPLKPELVERLVESQQKTIRSFQQRLVGELWDVLGGRVKAVSSFRGDLSRCGQNELGLIGNAGNMTLELDYEIGGMESPLYYPVFIYGLRNPAELYAMLWLGQGQDADPVYVFPEDASRATILSLLHSNFRKPLWYDVGCLELVDWVLTVGKDDTGFFFAARERAMLLDVLKRCGGKMVCCY